jgi:bifunctional non-homologous end joining protein LigD
VANLKEYRGKRDPDKSPEPAVDGVRGKRELPSGSRGAPIFVIQRHDARRLHYDLRLERNGALASWAVPKGMPLEPGQQHLAVHVEDHPIEYATFEGEIPKGEYGAGQVDIWDHGTYELLGEKRNGELTFRLDGERLQGAWTLIPAHLSGDAKNWLLIRRRDDAVKEAAARREYVPMLATPEQDVPHGRGWLFEVKWDGYRAICRLQGGEAELRSRRGNDLTARFAGVARALAKAVKTPDCVLDGEVCALDDEGRASFSAMQQGKPHTPIVIYVFDLLELEGAPLVDRPLTERREQLFNLLDRRNATVRFSEAFDDGDALLAAAREQGLEGVVAKREDSRYAVARRTRDWLKIKARNTDDFVIAGYTRGQGRRSTSFGSLVLAVNEAGQLRYAGNCGTGFNEAEIERLLGLLRPLERPTSPLATVPRMPKVRKSDVVWVEPDLVCEVEFAEWTHDGHLRAPAYKGLRDDKEPDEVRREEAEPLPAEIRSGRRMLKLSNLDKPFWPEEGITKGDLLRYYRAVAPVLVPHLAGRPFTMKRYPDGWQGAFFFQKDAPAGMPEWLERERILVSTRERPPRKKWIDAPIVNDELSLLWMVNMGCIDLNVWYSRIDRPERPDFVLFDLDPSADVGFAETVEVALLVKQALDALGLESFPKTSGSDGLHVLVPVARRYTYDDTREFSEIIARALARTHRGLVTTEWTRAKRRGVLIDSNQNGEGKTIASVYSVRPQAAAPVSTPLRWSEVNEKLDPAAFTMDVVLDRVSRDGDLYAPVLSERQSLTAALRSLR